MALSVDAKVYGPLSVPKTPSVRSQPKPAASDGESTQRAAQAFVETLPPEVRDRLAQANRDGQKRNGFDQAQAAPDEVQSSPLENEASFDRPAFNPTAPEQDPVYTAPILTPAATLLQAQLSDTGDVGLTSRQHATYHDAYLSAGAQPGGRASALEAALVREEQAQKTLIVPPVLTQVNFVT